MSLEILMVIIFFYNFSLISSDKIAFFFFFFFSASGIVKLINNWELTFRILSCHFFFCFCLLNPLQTFKLK